MHGTSITLNDVYSISSDVISSLLEDKNGNIWIGTDAAGICKYDKKSNRFIRYQANPSDPNSLSIDQISVMIEDRYGEIWIGSFGGGLTKFNTSKNLFSKINHNPDDSLGIPPVGIYSLYEDEKGIIWIGTYGSGLFAYDKLSERSIHYQNIPKDQQSISDDNISFVLDSEDGSIWVGTYNGLNKLDRNTGKFIRYSVADGLPNSMIYGILKDDDRNLWISTNKGLCKFNYHTGTFRTYTAKDGLQGDEFNQSACFKSKSGKMYFGGLNGFNVFNPDEIKDDTLKAPVKITSLLLFNKPVHVGFDKNLNRTILNKALSESDEIELTHHDYVFSLEFAALDFAIPENIKYAYLMEGFDKDWTYVNADKRFATYTNLDPGVYTFKVKSTNHDGIWNEAGTSLLIKY